MRRRDASRCGSAPARSDPRPLSPPGWRGTDSHGRMDPPNMRLTGSWLKLRCRRRPARAVRHESIASGPARDAERPDEPERRRNPDVSAIIARPAPPHPFPPVPSDAERPKEPESRRNPGVTAGQTRPCRAGQAPVPLRPPAGAGTDSHGLMDHPKRTLRGNGFNTWLRRGRESEQSPSIRTWPSEAIAVEIPDEPETRTDPAESELTRARKLSAMDTAASSSLALDQGGPWKRRPERPYSTSSVCGSISTARFMSTCSWRRSPGRSGGKDSGAFSCAERPIAAIYRSSLGGSRNPN